jgi:hypothetical protein
MPAAKIKKVTIPAASLTRATITLRDAVLSGAAIVAMVFIGGAAWNDITKDVKALQVDVTSIKNHQKEARATLDRLVNLMERK